MIHLFKTCMITAFILGLTWSAHSGHRINVTSVYAIQIRYGSREMFVLTSSGWIMAETMKDLAPHHHSATQRQIWSDAGDQKMETEAFGDSNATRTTDAFLETECVENVATTEIIKATEESNGHRVSLPLSVFNPQDYHPLLITVSGKNVN